MVRALLGSPGCDKGSKGQAPLVLALAILFASPAFAQDAGVSGIPPGPANINGINNTARDPSGIGNAAKVAPLPQSQIRPVTPPAVAPLSSTRPAMRSSRLRETTPRTSPRASRRTEQAQVRENDRLLKHGITSICRGC